MGSVLSKLLRTAALGLAGVAYWQALDSFDRTGIDLPAWKFVAASFLLSIVWQWRIGAARLPEGLQPVRAGTRRRVVVGCTLAVAGAVLFGWASWHLHRNWVAHFDTAWRSWIVAATLVGIGLDLAWGRWPRPSGLWSRTDLALAAALFTAGAVLRAYGLLQFPGPYHVTQIEELQVGKFGHDYLAGSRLRWEYLSHMWLSVLGQSLFTNDLMSVRIPFVAVNALKLIPFYFWLRWLVGRAGAVAATALLAFSGWDVVLSRIPTNQNELTAALSFALMAGPARRGRPSAYVLLGLIAGYVVYEYIAYRPLALFIVAATVWISLSDRSVGWARRLARPAVTLVIALVVCAPLFTGKLRSNIDHQYLDGWNRARGHGYYAEKTDWQQSIDKRVFRTRQAFGSLFFRGEETSVRNLDRRPMLDRVTAGLFVAGAGYAVSHWAGGLVPLSLIAFLVTFTGTLIATGNFDMARAGCNVVYTHALVGFGAAGVAALVSTLFGGFSRSWLVVAVVLAALWIGSASSSLRFLDAYWQSPKVRSDQHHELAYQTYWLGQMVEPGERVLGLSPRLFNLLLPTDATWMLGKHVHGTAVVDIWQLIEEMQKSQDDKVFLFVAADRAGPLAIAFLQSIWPQLKFERTEHPKYPESAIYFSHIGKADLAMSDPRAYQRARCRSASGVFAIDVATAERRRIAARFPFVDLSTLPQAVRALSWQGGGDASKVSLLLSFRFSVERPGSYVFAARSRFGTPTVEVAGKKGRGPDGVTVLLETGTHELKLTGRFSTALPEPDLKLEWRGPDTRGQRMLMPIYQLAPADLRCDEEPGETASNGNRAKGGAAASSQPEP